MTITLQAIRYMIWLHFFVALLALIFLMLGFSNLTFFEVVLIASMVGIYYLFLIGLGREKTWVAILFIGVSIVDIFGAISDGVSLVNILHLASAVLSLTAIYGIVIWFRERNPGASGAEDKQ